MSIPEIYKDAKKILIIGTYPPPLGGVSVHIYRLKRLLDKNNYSVSIFDVSKKTFPGLKTLHLIFLLMSHSWDIVHVHSSTPIIMALTGALKKKGNYRLFFTDHNPRLFKGLNKRRKNKIHKFLERLDLLVCVTEEIKENHLSSDMSLADRIIVLPAFIPPPLTDLEKITSGYPESLNQFVATHSPLLLTVAYQLNFFEGQDLYGVDMSIRLMTQLSEQFPDSGLIIALSNAEYNKSYLNKLSDQINSGSLAHRIYLLTGNNEIWPLIKKTDLFLRPTNSDGDAVSIREALYFDLPVLASDVTTRPPGCVTFKSRDQADYYRKATQLLIN